MERKDIVIKNEVNYVIIGCTLVCLLGFMFMFLIICYGLYQNPGKSDSGLAILLIILFFWDLGMLNRLLWLLRGKETIGIKNGYLTLEKTGGFFKRHRKYDLNFIDAFYSRNNFRQKWWYIGNRVVKIGFTYFGDEKSLSFPVTLQDAKTHINTLNEFLNSRKMY